MRVLAAQVAPGVELVHSTRGETLPHPGAPLSWALQVVTMLTDNRKHLIVADDLRLRDESNSRLSEEEHRAQLQRLCKAFLKGQ